MSIEAGGAFRCKTEDLTGEMRHLWVILNDPVAYPDCVVIVNVTSSPGPGTCRELGHAAPFDAARVSQLYPSAKDYTSKVNASVVKAVKEHFFTETDGKKMKADLAKEVAKK